MITLGNLKLGSPLILAPMAGYTDHPFRLICKNKGASLVVTELISADGIIRKNKKTIDLMYFTEEERPLGIQIFGNNPGIMAEAASIIEETLKPDLIDINMGCCAPKVCNGGSGAAITKDPETTYKIAVSVKNAVKIPVSAKIRIGWDKSSINYKETIKALEDAKMEFITVHGRTKSQKYEGLADWEIIDEISRTSSLPIIGNGDISSYDDAIDKLKSTNCKAIMIGRSALGNPWIFSDKKPKKVDILNQITEHFTEMIKFYGEYGVILSRKHLVKYIHGFNKAASYRTELITAKSSNEIFSILNKLKIEIV